jgi:hypothetical protein
VAVLHISVKYLKLGGYVLHRTGESDYRIPRFIGFATKSRCAHCGHSNRGAGHCGYDFNHGSNGYFSRLATLPFTKLPRATRLGALTVALTRELGLAGLVLKSASASFSLYSH